MRRPRLFWIIFSTYLLIVILTILSVFFFASRNMKEFYLQKVNDDLIARAELIKPHISKADAIDSTKLDELCKELGKASNTRITIVLSDGVVIADSDEIPSEMDNHRNRTEIREAILNDFGKSTRRSETLNQKMKYIAIPIIDDGDTFAVVRTAISISAIDDMFGSIMRNLLMSSMGILILASIIGYLGTRRVTRPLEQIREYASKVASGDFDEKIIVESTEEVTMLAETMNQMASVINERIEEITKERNEKETILSSMVEGVLAIDLDQRIFQINQAAAHLLDTSIDKATGRFIHEIIRNPSLQRFVQDILISEDTIERDIVFKGQQDKYVQVLGSSLKRSDDDQIGVLVVLNDITRLKNLERIRRDFVANVSHELKTPITSIKGFVETLIDGASENPVEMKRFLDIIIRQTNRLNEIIEDLLSLSHIEKETERDEIILETTPLKRVLKSAIDNVLHDAQTKEINIKLECDNSLKANINPQLLEQAVINLLTNALKYSDRGSVINVMAKVSDDKNNLDISVQDFGCGISEEHLPRLFERFYRVDKSRSREVGGSGLGLSIVKHIAQAHHGTVSVESDVGKGSVFIIHIPISE